MAHLRLLLIAIIAAVSYVTIAYSATLRSKDSVGTLQERAALNADNGNIRIERSIIHDKTNSSGGSVLRNCGTQPCGWFTYVPFARRKGEYISNRCVCADRGYKCVETDDDLSVSAYVYHCRQNTTSKNTYSPEQSYV